MSQSLRTAIIALSVTALSVPMYALAAKAREERKRWPVEESYVTLPPPSAARFAYAGYNELAADITWTRMLVYYGSGFVGEGDFRYLRKFVDNVIALDPRFKKLYEWAAYSVTVSVDHKVSSDAEDIMHSIEILERAMQEFPDDYEFFWLAGVRYFLDMKSEDQEQQRAYKEKGAEYLEQAMAKPNAPSDLANKAASFRWQLGQFEQARANLMQMVMTTDDQEARMKMLANFEGLADADLASELKTASESFRDLQLEHMPQVSKDLFVILGGPPPAPLIDFDVLATERDLIGAEADDAPLKLFE